MKENPRISMKIVYSCFDCIFFVNKSNFPNIEKDKYSCNIEKRDFSFDGMSPNGVPDWCPLPLYNKMKHEQFFEAFQIIFDKLEKNSGPKE